MECNPRELFIDIVVNRACDLYPWETAYFGKKVVPQIRKVNYLTSHIADSDYADVFYFKELTQGILDEIQERERVFKEAGAIDYIQYKELGGDRYNQVVTIITEFQAYWDMANEELRDWLTKAWESIIGDSEDVGMFFVMASQSTHKSISDACVSYFTTKACLKASESLSRFILGDGRAACNLSKYGDCFIKYASKDPIHIYIPFYPDTWISKFIRYYSVHVG